MQQCRKDGTVDSKFGSITWRSVKQNRLGRRARKSKLGDFWTKLDICQFVDSRAVKFILLFQQVIVRANE
jgi:hypothetical protein